MKRFRTISKIFIFIYLLFLLALIFYALGYSYFTGYPYIRIFYSQGYIESILETDLPESAYHIQPFHINQIFSSTEPFIRFHLPSKDVDAFFDQLCFDKYYFEYDGVYDLRRFWYSPHWITDLQDIKFFEQFSCNREKYSYTIIVDKENSSFCVIYIMIKVHCYGDTDTSYWCDKYRTRYDDSLN